MGLEKVESLSHFSEKEGGIVREESEPVNDRIDNLKSESKIISKVFLINFVLINKRVYPYRPMEKC